MSSVESVRFDTPIAHRGLHDPRGQRPENSLAALAAAVAVGWAAEIDVRLTADGVPVVHHDATLRRLSGQMVPVRDADAGWLTRQRLAGTEERIPTLRAALDVVGGRVPLLLDLKPGWTASERIRLSRAVLEALRGYPGVVAVVSFDVLLLHALAAECPWLLRGQTTGWWGPGHLWVRRLARPHFLSVNVERLTGPARERSHDLTVLGWTVRTTEQLRHALPRVDNVIVEGPAAAALLGPPWEPARMPAAQPHPTPAAPRPAQIGVGRPAGR